jgi:hypothetical protein
MNVKFIVSFLKMVPPLWIRRLYIEHVLFGWLILVFWLHAFISYWYIVDSILSNMWRLSWILMILNRFIRLSPLLMLHLKGAALSCTQIWQDFIVLDLISLRPKHYFWLSVFISMNWKCNHASIDIEKSLNRYILRVDDGSVHRHFRCQFLMIRLLPCVKNWSPIKSCISYALTMPLSCWAFIWNKA